MRFLPRTRGFSLLELLLCLTLLLLFTSLLLPSLTAFLKRTKTELLLTELTGALDFARREAWVMETRLQLCGSEDQKTCSASWQKGLIVVLEGGKEVLQAFSFGRLAGHLHWRAFPLKKSYLQFLPSGGLDQENGSFWFCPSEGRNPLWAIAVSKSGRARLVYPDKSGMIQDERGLALPCSPG